MTVDYTSTRPQKLVRGDDRVQAPTQFSSRGRIIGSNIGTAGFITISLLGTTVHHLVDDGNGGLLPLHDKDGTKVDDTIISDPVRDTAVVQYLPGLAVPSQHGYRIPIRGEKVKKGRTDQSKPSIGKVDALSNENVRIMDVNQAHAGDSGQLWIANSDGEAAAVHQEGHDLSQGSAQGAQFTSHNFPGLVPEDAD